MDVLETGLLKIDGFGPEVVALMIVAVVLPLIWLILYMCWKLASRRSLDYEIFIIEMHTLRTKRIVVVIHIGAGNFPRTREFYSNLIERIRERTRIRYGNDFIAVSDTNVVVNAPTTMADLNFPRQPSNRLTMWEIEVPVGDQPPDNARDGERAAAVAICVLSRTRALQRNGTTGRNFSQVVQINNRRVLNVDLTHAIRREENQVEVIQNTSPTMYVTLSPSGSRARVNEATENVDAENEAPSPFEILAPSPEGNAESSDSEESEISTDTDDEDDEQRPPETEATEVPLDQQSGALIKLKFLDDTQIVTRADLSPKS